MDELDAGYRLELTRSIMNLLMDWGLSPRDIVNVLEIKGVSVRHIERYRRTTPFPEDPALDEKIEHLVGISEGLRTAYPHSRQAGKNWLQKPQPRLGRRAPLAVIVNEGLNGIKSVRAELDCAFAWDQVNKGFPAK